MTPHPDRCRGEAPHREGLITQDEFMEKIKAERAAYQAMFQKVNRGGH